MQKVLVFIFIGLMLVLLGEGLFYVFQAKNASKILPTSQPAEEPTGTPENPIAKEFRAIDDTNVNLLKLYYKDVLISSIIMNEFQGTVIKLNNEVPKYAFNIRIEGPNGKSNEFKFSKDQLSKLKFYTEGTNSARVAIKMEELKIGDSVSLILSQNLLKDYQKRLISGLLIRQNAK